MNNSDDRERSKQIWLWALLAILAVTTIGSAIVAFMLMKEPAARGNVASAARADSGGITPIDLTAYYDATGAWERPGEWEDIPHGQHAFGGVLFEANGMFKLIGEGARKDKRPYRASVEGIVV